MNSYKVIKFYNARARENSSQKIVTSSTATGMARNGTNKNVTRIRSEDSSSNNGAVIGIIVGVIFAAIAFFCICYCINLQMKARQRRARKTRSLPFLGEVPHDYKSIDEDKTKDANEDDDDNDGNDENDDEDDKDKSKKDEPTTVTGQVVKAVQEAVTGTGGKKSTPPKQSINDGKGKQSDPELTLKPVKSNDDELKKNPKDFKQMTSKSNQVKSGKNDENKTKSMNKNPNIIVFK